MEKQLQFLARPGFMTREVAGEIILVPINTNQVLLDKDGDARLEDFNGIVELNEVGLFIWKQIETPKTLDELVLLVQQEYDSQDECIREDIIQFLDNGIRNQIIFIVKN